MRALVPLLFVLIIGFGPEHRIAAQTTDIPLPGDPPVAALIDVSPPDDEGLVTISGVDGAVFPAAEIGILNLYTEHRVFATANVNGAFSVHLPGTSGTPYWISPAASIPLTLRDRTGALPGGPGTVVYVPVADKSQSPVPVTSVIVDGDPEDWAGYPDADLGNGIFALFNADSLYVALRQFVPSDAQLDLHFRLDDMRYVLSLIPSLPQAALLQQVAPEVRDLGAHAVASVAGPNAVELRIPLTGIRDGIEIVTIDEIQVRTFDEAFAAAPDSLSVPYVNERDGIVYQDGPLHDTGMHRFTVAGPLAQGASSWMAEGRISTLQASPGDTLILEMDITLDIPALPESLVGLALRGEIGLQPVVTGTNGSRQIAALHSNNGWSNLLTPSGLAIDNVRGDMTLAAVSIPAAQVIRRESSLLAGFRFALELPPDLPPGRYVPVFTGRAQVGDGEIFTWTEHSRVFGEGPGISRMPLTRLPLVLDIGGLDEAHLLWALWHDQPSNGSRGVLAELAQGQAALSNRVRFNSPTYILPPGEYPLEPYLPNLLPNADDVITAPLLALDLPGGLLAGTVTRPDGTIDSLSQVAFAQVQLSTIGVDERDRAGGQSPRNVTRLATLDPSYRAYPFDRYGAYTVELAGYVEDVFGSRYDGGGTYHLLIAEEILLLPGVLPGTPFELGDAFFAGGRVLPGVPADIQISVRLYPLVGDVVERTFSGKANIDGYFTLDDGDSFRFSLPGEYVIDYEVRYTGPDGRLWAASQRSAGVVAAPLSSLVARGVRGLMGGEALRGDRPGKYRPAWFTTVSYPPVESLVELPPRPYYPYHAGDIALVHANRESGIRPVIHVQDTGSDYRDWLLQTLPDVSSAYGISLEELAREGSLPLFSVTGSPDDYAPALHPDAVNHQAYAYINAVRPGVTVRQFVLGDDDPALAIHWDGRDPYNGQIGAGVEGDRPGDYTFLFGGAVVRNMETGLRTVVPYAALAVVVDENRPVGVIPPYSESHLTVRDAPIDLFFHPTGVSPGQVLEAGQTFAIAGQAAPARLSEVTAVITSPSGIQRTVAGLTNALGYFYDPSQDFIADETGIWTVQIALTPVGETSVGPVEPTLPVGGVLGSEAGTYTVVVIAPQASSLRWTLDGTVDVVVRPGAAQIFTLSVPDGWQETRAYYTVATPSYVLATGMMDIAGNTASYRFDPVGLGSDFPNLETDGSGQGPGASDVIMLTFAVAGVDEMGRSVVQARMVTIFHDRLLSFEE